MRSLTHRENEVVNELVLNCLSTKEVAQKLGLSPRTVEDHRANVMTKFGARNLAELCKRVYENRPLLNPEQAVRLTT